MINLSKSWGQTSRLQCDRDSETWLADIQAGGYSSRHSHSRHDNIFLVLSGVLVIYQYDSSSPEDVQIVWKLNKGMSAIILAGQIHKFEAITDVRLLETYIPLGEATTTSMEDIHRLDEGGVRIPT